MHYRLSTEEANILRSQVLPDSRLSLDDRDFHRSAANWTGKCLPALNVVYLDILPLRRFFSDRFIPNDENEGMLQRESC